MSDHATRTGAPQAPTLQALLRAIASHDRAAAARMLAESPALAQQALDAGATRAEESPHYFATIARFVYAGDTPLHIAAAAYEAGIAEELVSRGAHVYARNRRGAEPLHYAADGNPGADTWNPAAQSATIAYLIAAGANPDAQDNSGVAPLHRAVRTRCAAAVQALLVGGADARGRNKRGSTPLHLAVQNTGRGGTGSAAARKQQEQIIRLLLDYGARPADADAAGRSAQECATSDWIRALLGQQ